MTTIDELNEKISQLKAAIPVLQSAAGYASSISKDTNFCSNALNSTIEVNDNPIGVSNSLMAISEDMLETSNYINNQLVPSCYERIQGYRAAIQKIEEENRRSQEEYERQQEELRKQEEASKTAKNNVKSTTSTKNTTTTTSTKNSITSLSSKASSSFNIKNSTLSNSNLKTGFAKKNLF